ncbi:MAG: glycoside hydrolase family 2 TIM barrel-domain containing protein [Thermoguttaceae bacterium]
MRTVSRIVNVHVVWLGCFLSCGSLWLSAATAAESPKNLALDAKATASETQDDLSPEKAIDGRMDTRWSGIPGHNEGVWYQLEWKDPIEVGEVVIRQFDTFAMEWNVQVLDAKTAEWRTVQHFGKPGVKLPLVVTCRFTPCKVTGVRIADITNGPSFNEVEVYSRPFARGLATRVASDLQGHFIGIVSDADGASPVEGAAVTLSGTSPAGPWKSTAKSDAKGLFTADMPVRLTGPVAIRTALKTPQFEVAPSESQVGSEGFEFCLTPREARRNPVALNDGWKFKLDPPEGFWAADFDDADWAKIKVPAHWEMEGFHNDTGVGGYRLHFTAPTEPGRIKLDFEGVYSGAEVWVNGQLVATHEGGALPFEADITDVVKPGDNVLALRVREHTVVSDKLDHMSLYADFHLAGIMRPVYLFTTPNVHLADLKIVTTFDNDYRDATMVVRGRVLNESAQAFRGLAKAELVPTPPKGSLVFQFEEAWVEVGAWGSREVQLVFAAKAPEKWNAEQPNLYTLTPQILTEGEKVIEKFGMKVGFRQTEIRGTEILINGKPVKFRGTCRHDAHPLLGRAVTAEIARRDLLLMKEANLNAVRTSHYPPVRELAENADELGVYVEAEGSFCWAEETNDLRNTPRILQMEAELLARDRNRPSVAYWSVCNESEFGYGLQRAHEWIRKTDPSRPTGAATSAWLEIATWHNPMAVSRIQENEKVNKPLLFDESLGIFQGIYGDGFLLWTDPGMRDYYAQPLPAVLDAFMKSKVTQGTYIWCWADDVFCVPNRGIEFGRDVTQCFFVGGSYGIRGRGIVGDAPWGVIDGWQRRKPEFWITKKVHSPIKVKESPLPLPGADGIVKVPVENQYDFRNLSDLRVRWTLGGQQGETRADVPARSTGEIAIHLDEAAKAGEMLSLEFREADGRLIDAYRVPLGGEPPHVAPGEKCSSAPLEITHTNYLQGAMTSIVGKDFQLAVNEATGRMKRCLIKGRVLLLELPLLHVSPEKRVTHPLPDVESWHLDKFDVRKEGDNVLLSIDGRYTNFEGGYRITVTPIGELTVASTFKYSGDDLLAHEIGLRFSVPTDCDVLDWDRRGEWNVYPSDHIGRPVGTARAFPKLANTVPPTDPWSQEISPMGSNDFRSTKRHIHWAAIHYPDGPGAIVESNGHQHVRAMVQSDRTSVYVNDWYGGAGTSYWEWTRNYGEGKPIHKGDTLTSGVRLRISPRIGGVETETLSPLRRPHESPRTYSSRSA